MVLLHRLAHSQEADEDVCGASPGLRGEGGGELHDSGALYTCTRSRVRRRFLHLKRRLIVLSGLRSCASSLYQLCIAYNLLPLSSGPFFGDVVFRSSARKTRQLRGVIQIAAGGQAEATVAEIPARPRAPHVLHHDNQPHGGAVCDVKQTARGPGPRTRSTTFLKFPKAPRTPPSAERATPRSASGCRPHRFCRNGGAQREDQRAPPHHPASVFQVTKHKQRGRAPAQPGRRRPLCARTITNAGKMHPP